MAAHTALDLITASLKRIAVISGIETPTADQAADGLARLNDLLETWRTESLALWAVTTWPLPAQPAVGDSYRLGPGGDLTTRPDHLQGVSLRLTGTPTPEYPLLPLDDAGWRLERVKAQTSPHATHFYYQTLWPQALLHLWPRLTAGSVLGVTVYALVEISAVPVLTTAMDFPPGYYRALRDTLAIELAPEYARQIDGALAMSALDAKAQLQRQNFRPRTLTIDPALQGVCGTGRGGYDWRTDS